MNKSYISWEIILAGILLTGAAIYTLGTGEADNTAEKKTVVIKGLSGTDAPTRLEFDTEELQQLEQLQKLEQLEQLAQLKELEELKNLNIDKEKIKVLVSKIDDKLRHSDHIRVHISDESHANSISSGSSTEGWRQDGGTFVFSNKLAAADLQHADISLDGGHMELVGVEGSSDIELKVEISGDIDNVEEAASRYRVSMSGRSGKATITLDKQNRHGWGENVSAKAYLSLPHSINVEASTRGGHVEAKNLDGNLNIKTFGGHINLAQLSGQSSAKTNGGHISCDMLKGDYELKTNGGHITINRFDGSVRAKTSGGHIKMSDFSGSAEAKTLGGNITADVHSLNGDFNLNTSAGNVQINLPKNSAADLDLRGSKVIVVGNNLDIGERSTSGSLQTKINGGGPTVKASCSYGTVTVKAEN